MQQRVTGLTAASVARLWRTLGQDFSSDWVYARPRVLFTVQQGREASVRAAEGYTAAVLAETGQVAPAVGALVSSRFTASAPDGRPMGSLLDGSLIATKSAVAGGASVRESLRSGGSFEPVTRDAGKALAENAELNILADLKANGTSAGTAAITTPALAYAAVTAMRTALVKAKVPSSDRILAVSPEFAALLLGEASKLTSFDPIGDEPVRNGVIGRLLGFTVIEHPLLTHTSNRPAAVGFHAPSVAYVGQIEKVEAGRMELAFADYIRVLNVYGTKVLRPTAVQTYLPAA